MLTCNRLPNCAPFASPTGFPSLFLYPRRTCLPRCCSLRPRRVSSLHTRPAAALPCLESTPSTPSRLVACSASEDRGSKISRHGAAGSSEDDGKQRHQQIAGTRNGSRSKDEGSAAKEKGGDSSTKRHAAHRKLDKKRGNGPGGNTTRRNVGAKSGTTGQSQGSAPQQSSTRQWQGQSGQQGVGHKRSREGLPSRSSSDSSSSSKRQKTRGRPDTGAPLKAKNVWTPSWDACMRAVKAASTPLESFEALYSLGKRVQDDDDDKKQYTQMEREGIVEAAHALAAQMLGLQAPTLLGSNSSTNSASLTISGHTSSPSPILQLGSKQLSLTVWAFSQLVGVDSRSRSKYLIVLVDAIAARVVGSSVMNTTTDDACMHWSRLLYGIAKMGFSCRDSAAVQQLFGAGAKQLPHMLRRKQECAPQNVSNPLWAFATAEYGGSLQQLVSEVASNLGWVMKNAKPQNWSNAVWALATMHSRKVVLGEHSAVVKILSAGVEGMVQQRQRANPQALSNTLWALATLDHNPGNATINILATAMAERSSMAKPQELSNTLHGLGSLRWYQPKVYSKLVERLMQSISSSNAVGQHFSNALFNCALSCHFDSSVDALAAWGSEQSFLLWTEQEVSNTLFAWAILAATAGGDTAHMRSLAQRLFKEANRRGAARFTVGNDLGKLYGAHLTAQQVGLLGGGLTDSKLLQVAQRDTAEWQQEISRQESSVTNAVTTALQGHYEVQAVMVQGYHTILMAHSSCPRGIAIVVYQHYRDYLSHPAGQLYGKTALRLKHVERGCDGVVLCDESELRGCSVEQQSSMLMRRIEQAVEQEKRVC